MTDWALHVGWVACKWAFYGGLVWIVLGFIGGFLGVNITGFIWRCIKGVGTAIKWFFLIALGFAGVFYWSYLLGVDVTDLLSLGALAFAFIGIFGRYQEAQKKIAALRDIRAKVQADYDAYAATLQKERDTAEIGRRNLSAIASLRRQVQMGLQRLSLLEAQLGMGQQL